ncbi:MAG: hypothetical protein HQK53_14710, partial [Oligoflexia bacterium]|nr:hypothetical protein [Oligoflexia bacterium]
MTFVSKAPPYVQIKIFNTKKLTLSNLKLNNELSKIGVINAISNVIEAKTVLIALASNDFTTTYLCLCDLQEDKIISINNLNYSMLNDGYSNYYSIELKLYDKNNFLISFMDMNSLERHLI